jgi:hypothetical protein
MKVGELTKEEKNAIAAFKRLAARWPSSLHVIVVDGDGVSICKYGVPAREICKWVDLKVSAGASLEDIHDQGLY